jgi:hypothetical protein
MDFVLNPIRVVQVGIIKEVTATYQDEVLGSREAHFFRIS